MNSQNKNLTLILSLNCYLFVLINIILVLNLVKLCVLPFPPSPVNICKTTKETSNKTLHIYLLTRID